MRYLSLIILNRNKEEITKISFFEGYIDTRIGPLQIQQEEGFATAKVLDFFNKLFDSVNAREMKSETPLRTAVTRKSAHHSFWYDAIKQLKDIRFIHKRKKNVSLLHL